MTSASEFEDPRNGVKLTKRTRARFLKSKLQMNKIIRGQLIKNSVAYDGFEHFGVKICIIYGMEVLN